MAPKLYWYLDSPPARAVVLCSKLMGLELELIEVRLYNREQNEPKYLKMNPLHTVPVLDDDGFIVTDSHAIMSYLVSKYGNGSSLYPQDVKKRSVVDQRLFFECGTLFPNHLKVCVPVIYQRETTIRPDVLAALLEAYGALEQYLQNSKYVAGDDITIADFSIWTTLTNASPYLPVGEEMFPKLAAWLERMDANPGSEMNKLAGERTQKKFTVALTPR